MSTHVHKILIIEDVLSMAMLYGKQLEAEGYEVHIAEDLAKAHDTQNKFHFDMLLLDLNLPDGDGLSYLESHRGTDLETPAIVITADASLTNAIHAMKLGALDYLVKPFSEGRLITTVNNTLERVALRTQVDSLRQATHKNDMFCDFVGNSMAMQSVYRTIEHVASSKATVFVTGASGTGKELCAEAIHKCGPRAGKPFVPVNCAAIPHDLLESELFGHLKGSFTGAIADRKGAAREAEGGTLFLDEMCELDLNLQKKLLRFLQTSTVHPVGASKPQKVDVRVVCATNRDPLQEVREGRFREDLYFRLNVVPLHLPNLNERENDVLDLAEFFLNKYSIEEGKNFQGFAHEAEAVLRTHTWPGNVRELENTIRHITILHDGDSVQANMFPEQNISGSVQHKSQQNSLGATAHVVAANPPPNTVTADAVDTGLISLAEIERKAIESRISAFGGSIPRAAESLGVSPSTIYRKKETWK